VPDGYRVYDRLTGRQYVEFAIRSKGVDDTPDAALAAIRDLSGVSAVTTGGDTLLVTAESAALTDIITTIVVRDGAAHSGSRGIRFRRSGGERYGIGDTDRGQGVSTIWSEDR
jgi:hypothetical protein